MGYDVEFLKGTKSDVEKSPVIRAKKLKKCEKSGDEDWNYLIESKHHELCYDQTLNVLRMGRSNAETEMQTDVENSCSITETPSISNRSNNNNNNPDGRCDFFDASRTPIEKTRQYGSGKKLKSSFVRYQDKSSLESIDETPMQPKPSFSKAKLTAHKFKMCLDQGM